MAKKYTRSDDLTRHLYESSKQQPRTQRINQNKANLPGDHEPAKLGNAAFPPLKGVVGEDQNGSDAIPPVPAQVVPTGTQTWRQVVKGESSSASGRLDSSSNPPCAENPPDQQISSTSANAEDPSSNAAAAVNYLDAGQVSATIESSSTSTTTTMRISRLEPYSEYNLWKPNPSFPLTLHELFRAHRSLKDAIEQSKNREAIPVPTQQVPPITQTWREIVKGESSASRKSNPPYAENPSEQKITRISSNAEEPSQDPASANAVEPSKDPSSTNAADAAAVKSDLDVGQVSATTESASTSTTMSGQEPHSKHNLSNPNPENSSEQQIISTSSNADEKSEDPARTNADAQSEDPASTNADEQSEDTASTNAADAAAVDSDLESASTSSEHSIIYRDASDSELDVQTSDAKLVPPSIKEEILNRSPAHDSSFQQSEDLQRGNLSNSTKALVFFCLLLWILLTLIVHGVE